jgi:hypothetical protein
MLLDEIITILSSTSGNLTDALLKTKVLLHQIGRKDLVTWVNNELKGYPDDSVPDYRVVSTEVHGQLTSIAWQVTDYLLPIQHLKPETQKSLTSFAMTASLQIIEESVKQHRENSSHGMRRNLPTEATAMFQKALQGGVNVISAWCEINMQTVENILAEVRSRLLDFVLELRDVVGKNADEGQLEEKVASVDAGKLFNTAIYGSGNTVVLGVHSTQTVTVTNTKGDIDGLVKALANAGIPEQELKELRVAIAEDESKHLVPIVSEGNTGKWFVKLLGRAVNKTIDVGVDVVSSTVAKTIAAYSGMPV